MRNLLHLILNKPEIEILKLSKKTFKNIKTTTTINRQLMNFAQNLDKPRVAPDDVGARLDDQRDVLQILLH
jgi:hypothetical protein